MICFTIALRSEKSTNQWDNVLADFNNTLKSIFNQTNSEFVVYVGCNEIPKLSETYDERLRFVITDLPVPKSWEECCRDRSWKLLSCAKAIKKDFLNTLTSGQGLFVFPVDADDFVNQKIAQWCYDHPNENGFKSKNGYRWIKGDRYAVITKYFGGTMNVMKMFLDDFPDELPSETLCFDRQTAMELTKRYPIRWYDIEVEGKYAEIGRPLSIFPFRSTVYVLGTGANISENDSSKCESKEKKRFHPVAFLRKINPFDKKIMSKKLKREFGMI